MTRCVSCILAGTLLGLLIPLVIGLALVEFTDDYPDLR